MKLKSSHKKIALCVISFLLAVVLFKLMPVIIIETNFLVSFLSGALLVASVVCSMLLPFFFFGEIWYEWISDKLYKFNNWISQDDE